MKPWGTQDKPDSASYVRDKDGKIFYTANGRSVRDAGGIEPDIRVTENVLTPTEKVLVAERVQQVREEYLKTHDVMNDMRDIVTEESWKGCRPAVCRWQLSNGNVVGRWLVLQTSRAAQCEAT